MPASRSCSTVLACLALQHYWPDHRVEELFDVVADLREEHDLSRDPALTPTLVDLCRRFATASAAAR